MEKEQQNPVVDQLLARFTQQQGLLSRQKQQLDENAEDNRSSSPTDPYAGTPPIDSAVDMSGRPDAAEVFRLKKELELAKERMAQMDLELTQSRIARHTVEEAIGSPFPAAQHLAFNLSVPGVMSAPTSFQGRTSPLPPIGRGAHRAGLGLRVDTGLSSDNDVYSSHT